METIYLVRSRNMGNNHIIITGAYRSYESAVAERDRLNEKWVGKFVHTIEITNLV